MERWKNYWMNWFRPSRTRKVMRLAATIMENFLMDTPDGKWAVSCR